MAPYIAIKVDFFIVIQRTVFSEIPKGISQNEINQLFQFFQVVSVINFAENLDIKVMPLILLSQKNENNNFNFGAFFITGVVCFLLVIVGHCVKLGCFDKRENRNKSNLTTIKTMGR